MNAPLAVIGNVNVDLILGPAAPWPKAGTEIIVDHDELRVGGAAGNSALAWEGARASTSRSPPISATTSSAAGCAKPSAAGPRNGRSGRKARRFRSASPIRTANAPSSPRAGTCRVFSLADVLAVLDGTRLSGGYALLCGSFLTDDLTRDYDALFDWADSHGITRGARYRLAARRLDGGKLRRRRAAGSPAAAARC